jgi:hypothetical protein
MTTQLPSKFFGKFKLERSENFEEYLAARGVSWILRKMIAFSSITKVFEPSKKEDGRYNMYNLSSKKNTAYENWALGETFEGEGMDDTKHKITFSMVDEDTLAETHLRMEMPDDKGETYHYTVEQDRLILKLESGSIHCRRYFKKIE